MLSIKKRQKYLKALGYYTGKIDGKFGPLSKSATKEFQKDQKLKVDGICGANTCHQLEVIINNNYTIGDVKLTINNLNGKTEVLYLSENCYLSKYFRLKEYQMHKDTCKKAGISESERNIVILDNNLILADTKLRKKFGVCTISSGYRSKKYNAYIGGASASKHILGMASDKTFKNATPKQVQAYIRANYTSLGIYGVESKTTPNCNNYTHSDTYKRNGNKLVEF